MKPEAGELYETGSEVMMAEAANSLVAALLSFSGMRRREEDGRQAPRSSERTGSWAPEDTELQC